VQEKTEKSEEFVWQAEHTPPDFPWLIGNQVWLNVAPVQAVVVWQVWQVVGKPAAVWFGLVVVW
jgi:hypothetical protein